MRDHASEGEYAHGSVDHRSRPPSSTGEKGRRDILGNRFHRYHPSEHAAGNGREVFPISAQEIGDVVVKDTLRN